MKNNIYFLFIVLLFLSCEKKYNAQEYLDLVNADEDYSKQTELDEYVFKAAYRPSSYMGIIEATNSYNSQHLQQNFETEKNKFSNTLYFNFTIGLKDSSSVIPRKEIDMTTYNLLQNYLANDMGQSFYLLTSNMDTIKTPIYQYLKSNNYSPNLNFLIGFPKSELIKKESNYLEFVYDDRIFNLSNAVKIRFDADIINNKEPEIIF